MLGYLIYTCLVHRYTSFLAIQHAALFHFTQHTQHVFGFNISDSPFSPYRIRYKILFNNFKLNYLPYPQLYPLIILLHFKSTFL